jgi:hypothetical protein
LKICSRSRNSAYSSARVCLNLSTGGVYHSRSILGVLPRFRSLRNGVTKQPRVSPLALKK